MQEAVLAGGVARDAACPAPGHTPRHFMATCEGVTGALTLFLPMTSGDLGLQVLWSSSPET